MPTQQDQSVDEILASIRRIIAEESPAPSPAIAGSGPEPRVELDPLDDEADEPLLLTEMAPSEAASSGDSLRFTRNQSPPRGAGSNGNGNHDVLLLTDPLDPPPATRSGRPEPAAPARPAPEPPHTMPPQAPPGPSAGADHAGISGGVHHPSAEMISAATREAVDRAFSALVTESASAGSAGTGPDAGETLEGLVRTALRPVLRQWLDQHLPDIVQTIVEREIARLSTNRS